MAANRKAAEDIILNTISTISSHKENVAMYKAKFAKMSDGEFSAFMSDLASKKVRLAIVEPNYSKTPDVPNEVVMKHIEKLGGNIMQRIWISGKDNLPDHLTSVEYPVFLTTVRRASQSLTKKISVPPHTRVRDLLTGQVTGESKGATVSGPENQLLAASDAVFVATEMNKYRGGDKRGEAALVALISKTGRASQEVLQHFSSEVQAKVALRTFLTAAMHRVNL